MCSNVTEITNSLISSGYSTLKMTATKNNSTNNIDAILESSENKVKTLAQRTNGLTLVPFLPRTISLPFSVSLTTEISFLSIAFFCFFYC